MTQQELIERIDEASYDISRWLSSGRAVTLIEAKARIQAEVIGLRQEFRALKAPDYGTPERPAYDEKFAAFELATESLEIVANMYQEAIWILMDRK